VSAWISVEYQKSDVAWWATMRNASDEPIYDVQVTLVPDDSPFSHDPEAARAEPAVAKSFRPRGGDLGRLPPGETIRFVGARQEEKANVPLVLGFSFTDSQGRRWKRRPNGTLVELTKPQQRSPKDRLDTFAKGQIDALDT
jgi:hypothetical protein